MRKLNYQNYFWIVLVVAIAVDTSFDFIAFRQSRLADATGDVVVRTYKVMDELGTTGGFVRENLRANVEHDKPQEIASLKSLREHFATLTTLTKDSPEQAARLAHLDFLKVSSVEKLSAKQLDQIARTIGVARRSEEANLQHHLQQDETQNRIAQNQVFWASSIDIALLLFAGLLWILESRSRKRNEAALMAAINSLDASNLDLQKVLSAKSLQMRSAVHDLKNPLGSISGFADLLADDFDKPSSVLEMSNVIQKISKHTLELVSSLVESEARQKKIDASLQIVDLDSYIDDVCASLKPQLHKKHQTLYFPRSAVPHEIKGDPSKIWDLFMNLIGNAVKFSPIGGVIEVRLSRNEGNLRVEIEDDGPGFTAGDKEKAFQQYEKLSAKPTGGETSTGLGLSLAKDVVAFHSGNLQIENSAGESGALLIVELPAQRDDQWT